MVKRDITDERVIRYRDERTGRIMERQVGKGGPPCIYWSPYMIDILRKYYPTTTNEEVAAIVGVSELTLIRKAKELGIRKSAAYLRGVHSEAGRISQAIINKTGGYRYYRPGHRHSEETRRKISEGVRRYYRENPDAICRAREKRRSNQRYRNYEENRH